MFVLGMLACIYERDMDRIREQIAYAFRKKSEEVYAQNVALLAAGLRLGTRAPRLPGRRARRRRSTHPMVVMNGNEAHRRWAPRGGLRALRDVSDHAGDLGLALPRRDRSTGSAACSTRPKTRSRPRASRSARRTRATVALTITSGPGLALKTEFIGLAVMTETPLVVVDVQRGGPSTGLPTKVEQSDLLAVLYGQPGDAPKVVIAPATIEECFHCMITARRIAEAFRMRGDRPVATRTSPPAYSRSRARSSSERWMRHVARPGRRPAGHEAVRLGSSAPASRAGSFPGSQRRIHADGPRARRAAARSRTRADVHQHSSAMRSRKLAVLQTMLLPPPSTATTAATCSSSAGAARRARSRKRSTGCAPKDSACHRSTSRSSRRCSPDCERSFARFAKVCTVELNYSDEPDAPFITPENRRLRPARLAAARSDARRRRLLDPRARRAAPSGLDPRRHSREADQCPPDA